MTRFLKRFVFALVTLGIGALAYALLRAEGERSLRPVRSRDEAAGGGEPPAEDREPEPEAEPPEAEPPAAAVSPEVGAASGHCAATTKSGKPCRRQAEPGSQFCWQHGG